MRREEEEKGGGEEKVGAAAFPGHTDYSWLSGSIFWKRHKIEICQSLALR